jgi:hypothetical protein
LKNLKKKNKTIIYNNYLKKISKNFLVLLPSFTFKSQFFSNKTIFDDVVVSNRLRGLFIYKNFYKDFYKNDYSFYKKHLIGYNYYILISDVQKYLNIYKILDDKEYNSVGKVKLFLEDFNKNNFLINTNTFFIFNIYLLKSLEFYKILIFLHINLL